MEIQTPASKASDGYASNPEQWISLERQKAKTGKIDFWIYALSGQTDERAIATTGLMRCADGVMRIKNYFVRSDVRRKGIGKMALQHLLRQLACEGESAVVVLSVEGSAGQRLYQSSGAREIGRIFECSRAML